MTLEQSAVPEQATNSEMKPNSGDSFLRQAQEIVIGQFGQLHEQAHKVNRLIEDITQERRNLSVDREEVNFRLRFLDENKAQNLQKQRDSLIDQQNLIEQRDRYLENSLVDLNDTAKRLSLLIRQLEIASSQLTRTQLPGVGTVKINENPWEVALRAQLIQGQEEERNRLAREVHDGPAQVLANAAMQLDFVGQLFQKDRANAITELNALRGMMRESLVEVRRFMFNLQPKMLAEQGLGPTLQHYCTDFANHYGLIIELNLVELSGLLNPNQELVAFRVVQETLQNVRKHANATKVVVSGSRDPEGKVTLSIIDDGRGFDPTTQQPGMVTGAGLPGMRERAELVGGKLKINSKPGYGTEICLTI